MTTKVLIDKPIFEMILSHHPEVEMDLLRSVIPQVAARIGDRIKGEIAKIEEATARIEGGQYEHMLNAAIDAQLRKVAGNNHYSTLNEGAKETIKKWLSDTVTQEIKNLMASEISRKIDAAVKLAISDHLIGAVREADAKIDAHAKDAAEREVLALLRSGNLVVKS